MPTYKNPRQSAKLAAKILKGTMNLAIIQSEPKHAKDLTYIAISAKRHWNYPEAWIQHWLPQLSISAEYISSNEVWMMTDEGKPIGFYALSESVIASDEVAKQSQTETLGLLRREEHTPRNDISYYELGHLWVLPEYIGKGIGKQLLGHAFERCKLLNITTLKIYADPNAQPFYEKMGAKKIDEYHSELFGEDRVLPIMEINL